MINVDLLNSVFNEGVGNEKRAEIVSVLNQCLPKYEMDTKLRACAFIAQASAETCGFLFFRELGNKDYFNKYEPGTIIGKMLGNTQPDDGYTYRGRGALQLTGRNNYQEYQNITGLNIIHDPDLLLDLDNGFIVSCEFWVKHGLNELADKQEFTEITKRINGGTFGLKQRKSNYSELLTSWENQQENK